MSKVTNEVGFSKITSRKFAFYEPHVFPEKGGLTCTIIGGVGSISELDLYMAVLRTDNESWSGYTFTTEEEAMEDAYRMSKSAKAEWIRRANDTPRIAL